MNNNKGFTLVEILAVLVIISILMIISVPAIEKTEAKTKQKMYDTKIALAVKQAAMWGQDNRKCLYEGTGCPQFNNTNIPKPCVEDLKEAIVTCTITIGALAEDGYIDYDENETVQNPKDKSSMNDFMIDIIYNTTSNSVSSKVNIQNK